MNKFSELKRNFGVPVFPRGRAQVAQCRLAFSGIDFRDLPEFQLEALAGVSGKLQRMRPRIASMPRLPWDFANLRS